jgi:hypothetical protein
MVDRDISRVQRIVIPALRDGLPGVKVGSWVEDIDHRTYPIINVRRLGGPGLHPSIGRIDFAVIELTAYHDAGLIECEDLLLDARQIIYEMVENQTVTEHGYLHSYFETMGPTQFDSPFEDTWRIQALMQLGARPRRNKE